jgi:hypothetical protein
LLRYLVRSPGRPPHHHETRQLEVLDEVISGNAGHCVVRVVKSLLPVEPQTVDEGLSEIIGGRWGAGMG